MYIVIDIYVLENMYVWIRKSSSPLNWCGVCISDIIAWLYICVCVCINILDNHTYQYSVFNSPVNYITSNACFYSSTANCILGIWWYIDNNYLWYIFTRFKNNEKTKRMNVNILIFASRFTAMNTNVPKSNTVVRLPIAHWDLFYWHGLTLIPAWICNHMLSKMWAEK